MVSIVLYMELNRFLFSQNITPDSNTGGGRFGADFGVANDMAASELI